MNEKENKTKSPWRIVVGILAAAYIVYMFVSKDIIGIYSTMPAERFLPILVISLVILLIKGGFWGSIAYFIGWLTTGRKGKK